MPDGCVPGDTMSVQLPDGNCFDVVIPEGSHAGSVIQVEVPTTAETETIGLTVPDGVLPGEMFNVQSASGVVFEVMLPEGFASGDYLEVELPAAGPQPAGPQAGAPTPERPPEQEEPRGDSSPVCSSPLQPMPSSSAPLEMSPASMSGGTRFGDRFGSSNRFGASNRQPFFGGSVKDRVRDRNGIGGSGSKGPIIFCRSHRLRAPQPEPGCRFFVGEAVQLLRCEVWR